MAGYYQQKIRQLFTYINASEAGSCFEPASFLPKEFLLPVVPAQIRFLNSFLYLYFHMPSRYPYDPVDPILVETWLKGWAIARGTMAPVPDQGGFRIDVGWPDQQVRYVFPELSYGWQALQQTITQPYIFLKACATPEQIRPMLLPPWEICPPGFMMTRILGDSQASVHLPPSYYLETTRGAHPTAKVYTSFGDLAAMGSIVIVGQYAIFDRIATEQAHQRKGLGSAVMATLSDIARQEGATTGLLVATSQGKALYTHLNWQLYAPYTTIVIPAVER